MNELGLHISLMDKMHVSLDIVEHLISERNNMPAYMLRCRDELLTGIQYGCIRLTEKAGYSVECYGNDVWKNMDFLSTAFPHVSVLVRLYNYSNPNEDFAAECIVAGDVDDAYVLLSEYLRDARELEEFVNGYKEEGNGHS